MKKSLGIAFVFMFVLNLASAATKLPTDVQKFMETREGCDHFRSEPYQTDGDFDQEERRKFLAKQTKELCRGTDKQLAKLRNKYRKAPVVIESLKGFDDKIE